MGLTVASQGDRLLFKAGETVVDTGQGKDSKNQGIKGWEKEKCGTLWHFIFHDVLHLAVDININGKNYVVVAKSAEWFLNRNKFLPEIEVGKQNEASIKSLITQFVHKKSHPIEVMHHPMLKHVEAPKEQQSKEVLLKTKEEWGKLFEQQKISIPNMDKFLAENFKVAKGTNKFFVSPKDLPEIFAKAPKSSDPANADLQKKLGDAVRRNPTDPMKEVIKKHIEEAPAPNKPAGPGAIVDVKPPAPQPIPAPGGSGVKLEAKPDVRVDARPPIPRAPEMPSKPVEAPPSPHLNIKPPKTPKKAITVTPYKEPQTPQTVRSVRTPAAVSAPADQLSARENAIRQFAHLPEGHGAISYLDTIQSDQQAFASLKNSYAFSSGESGNYLYWVDSDGDVWRRELDLTAKDGIKLVDPENDKNSKIYKPTELATMVREN